MKLSSILAGSLVAASRFLAALAMSPNIDIVADVVARADPPLQTPAGTPASGAQVCVGCYTSKANMTVEETKGDVSSGSCRTACLAKKYTLEAVQGQSCYCGFAMPPDDTLVDDDKCNFKCPAFGKEACGSIGTPKHYTIFNMGVDVDPPIYEEKESSTSSTAAVHSSTASDAAPEETIVESKTPDSDSGDDDKKSDGPNIAGIVAGSVVGVVAVAGGAGALWFFMRRRRNTEIEEEHRRNAAVNAFISGSKPPGSSGSISMTDSRLDPVMAHRRLSDGSIADNEDYSRKILRVRWNSNTPLTDINC